MGILTGITFILSFYIGTNYYIAQRIFPGLKALLPQMSEKLYAGIYILLALSVIAGFLPLPTIPRRMFSWVSSYWLGVYVYLLMLFLLTDLLLFFGSIIGLLPSPWPRVVHVYAAFIVLFLTAGLVGYGLHHATVTKFVAYDIEIEEKTPLMGMKIVLVSDLHLGAINSEKRLPKIISDINSLHPDLVCLAGDIFNSDYYAINNPEEITDLFNTIEATYGVYGCLGNHDGGSTFGEMTALLQNSGIRLLNDEHVLIDDRLILLGRIDSSPIGGFGGLKRKDTSSILAALDMSLPVVVLDHRPSNMEQYGRGVDLILSGHTHTGQLFPFNLITKSLFTVDYGYYRKNKESPHVIVTSGVGTWAMPMRVGTHNEIVSILLH